MKILNFTKSGNKSERGSSMLEYALLSSLIAVVVIVALEGVGKASAKAFDETRLGMANMQGPDGETPVP